MRAAVKIQPEQVFQSVSVVVFARDGKKARGSWFPAEKQKEAHAAAASMGMNVLDVANDDLRQLATKLPQGRIFDSGKAFVPFVQGSVVDALATHLPRGQQMKIRLVGSANDPSKLAGADAATGKATPAPPHLPERLGRHQGW
jgi:hypothetical protein